MKSYYIRDKNGKAQKVEFSKTRVILVSDHYGKGRNDPRWGSVHACVGTVLGHSKDSEDPMRVQWDNERINIYHPDHLQIYGDQEMKDNPNFTFKRGRKPDSNPAKAVIKDYTEFIAKFKKQTSNER